MTFRFLAPAQAELLEGISYYSAIKAELGLRFEQAVADAVRSAVAHPERGAPRSRNTRRWLPKSFPYGLIYRASEAEVLVVAVAHQRKRPEYWARRV
jgi:plasmid stabilization system protein ParE